MSGEMQREVSEMPAGLLSDRQTRGYVGAHRMKNRRREALKAWWAAIRLCLSRGNKGEWEK